MKTTGVSGASLEVRTYISKLAIFVLIQLSHAFALLRFPAHTIPISRYFTSAPVQATRLQRNANQLLYNLAKHSI